ncbi:MAG: MiaB/RimO family radical SAM methylthiotransferase, partial [Clostridia bacterium]|nr:MiaB/RimO family radical SAM methylthiotransferase [Clostridia bacterium]
CSSQNDPSQYENKPNVCQITGVGGKMDIVNSIMSHIIAPKTVQQPPTEYEDDFHSELTRTRGFIKVQDGCNNFCSYCIIPYLRGRSRSRKLDAIVAEATDMADKTDEIVITGINVSAYGRDIGLTLLDLVKALAPVKSRKRFGSLECNVIDDELLIAMKNAGFCDSFHISLQSGSDTVLSRMNRKYTTSVFNEKCDLIRKHFPLAGITTDVIVAYPEETDDEFNQTLDFVNSVKFFEIHAFIYSARKGTKASGKKQIDKSIATVRSQKLRELGARLKSEFLSSLVGKTLEVLVEENDGEYNVGHANNYVKVYTSEPCYSLSKHKIIRPYRDGVIGEKI